MPKIFSQREVNEKRMRESQESFFVFSQAQRLLSSLRIKDLFLTTEDTESTEEEKVR